MDLPRLLTTPTSTETLRSGAWTHEEVMYMASLLRAFSLGALPAVPDGTQLRGFLASELGCNPMRVSKKLGHGHLDTQPLAPRIGRQSYCRDITLSVEKVQATLLHLNELRRSFLETAASLSVTSRPKRTRSSMQAHHGGHWRYEEELYAFKLVEAFMLGYLHLRDGSTLRGFVAGELGCCPMRVTKKLATGMLCGRHLPRRLGRVVYTEPRQTSIELDQVALAAREELRRLRKAYLRSSDLL
ncbi:hypothetical protein SPRG_06696 [Saprolegnia parasitica CBS 223.65]|uniref:Uncharacterized protein n=1 Tax=Saprolegnia parasitica (strain CBS 223.65) TaxID=695850 RepID=A0A067CNR1_SAPPC|nr:hypothetical protein SPRG_06696 [Saprolegnia parasitica CBS 223.65]KDO28457.1 hypothetical protein SPRG_06696 [Saprolegnia parasitica CBS 223.65]|eukprot:XP_012200897.1 hypothetical protein SPRG_06696 [Saprolegnia parasitica CBS 223.65]